MALIASALVLVVQIVVALRWPGGYSITQNAISDLGVTVCGAFTEQGLLIRNVCSPWHQVFNMGMIFSGLAILGGAVLLYRWWDQRSGRWGIIFLAVAGAFISAVGFAPWDLYPDVHDFTASAQAITQWIAMALIAIAAGRGSLRTVTIVALVISLLGFVLFVLTLDGITTPFLGLGGVERLSFDVLTLWVPLLGVAVLRAGDRAQPGPKRAVPLQRPAKRVGGWAALRPEPTDRDRPVTDVIDETREERL